MFLFILFLNEMKPSGTFYLYPLFCLSNKYYIFLKKFKYINVPLNSHPLNSQYQSILSQLKKGSGEGNGTPLSTLAWKIPWTEEPSTRQSMGSQRVGHD